MHRALDWFSALPVWRKVLAALFGALLVFSCVNLLVTAGEGLLGPSENEDTTSQVQMGEAPAGTTPGASADLTITRARWGGKKVVTKGRWSGEISSVHCDLFEGGTEELQVSEWWDRSAAADMDWPERTFRQVFRKAKGRNGAPIAPQGRYTVGCSGHFSGGSVRLRTARVEGAPPGRTSENTPPSHSG